MLLGRNISTLFEILDINVCRHNHKMKREKTIATTKPSSAVSKIRSKMKNCEVENFTFTCCVYWKFVQRAPHKIFMESIPPSIFSSFAFYFFVVYIAGFVRCYCEAPRNRFKLKSFLWYERARVNVPFALLILFNSVQLFIRCSPF